MPVLITNTSADWNKSWNAVRCRYLFRWLERYHAAKSYSHKIAFHLPDSTILGRDEVNALVARFGSVPGVAFGRPIVLVNPDRYLEWSQGYLDTIDLLGEGE